MPVSRRIRATWPSVTGLLALALIVVACGGGDDDDDGGGAEPPADVIMESDGAAAIGVTSSAFAEGEAIPVEFTCDGEGLSPPLEFSTVPDNAESLGLILLDPDAPGGSFTHWTVYEIGSDVTGFDAGSVPSGAVQGENDFGEEGYGPPCPPEGDGPHRYVFTLSALGTSPGLAAGASPDQAVEAIDGAAIALGQLTGTYER